MNSRALRRLASDHSALHSQPLPPNYLFPPSGTSDSDDLTQLDILLAGPTHTPFAAGVFKLHLTIPTTYPSAPPTAHFRTPIFHPNVDPQTGGVCVETLKRDWDTKLTLRDILIVIGCLLIQPNPDSALNAEAGALIQNDYDAYTRRAQLMTSIHAAVSKGLQDAVREAQCRGQVVEEEMEVDDKVGVKDFAVAEPSAAAPQRRRLGVSARQRGVAAASRRRAGESEGSPCGGGATATSTEDERRQQDQQQPTQPFVLQRTTDDIFGDMPVRSFHGQDDTNRSFDFDSSMTDADQENDATRSPVKPLTTPQLGTAVSPLRRPQGTPVPLGELVMDKPPAAPSPTSSNSSDCEEEAEYPPSPSKSPRRTSPRKKRQQAWSNPLRDTGEAESSRDAVSRPLDRTPPNLCQNPLSTTSALAATSHSVSFAPTTDSTMAGGFTISDETPSPRKAARTTKHQQPLQRPHTKFGNLFAAPKTPSGGKKKEKGVFKATSPSSAEKRESEKQKRVELDAKLWKLCGGDVGRWNRGDFDGDPFGVKKGGRW